MPASPERFSTSLCRHLRSVALALPETSEGTSCVNRAFKVGKKNFLFVGERKDHLYVMVKLDGSFEKARALKDPRVDVGKIGWVTLRFPEDDALDRKLLADWVVESYRSLAPKTLVRKLDPL